MVLSKSSRNNAKLVRNIKSLYKRNASKVHCVKSAIA